MRKLTVEKEGAGFVVDEPRRPGSPLVGRGATISEALANWFRSNHEDLGFEIEVKPDAQTAEDLRRKKLLRER
jgi:hypothetical protein